MNSEDPLGPSYSRVRMPGNEADCRGKKPSKGFHLLSQRQVLNEEFNFNWELPSPGIHWWYDSFLSFLCWSAEYLPFALCPCCSMSRLPLRFLRASPTSLASLVCGQLSTDGRMLLGLKDMNDSVKPNNQQGGQLWCWAVGKIKLIQGEWFLAAGY